MKQEFRRKLCLYLIIATSVLWMGLSKNFAGAAAFRFDDHPIVKLSSPSDTPKKRALIVGISQYCPAGKERGCNVNGAYWWNLNTDAEVDALAQVLKDPNGQYRFDEVKILKNSEATHKNIVETFRSFLIGQTNPKDIAYFHYSGHGGQVPDDDKHGWNPVIGDEMDGLDESLIPFDYKVGKDGSNDIRDDEIGILLKELQAKSPGNVTLTFDSCHSGSIQRGGTSVVRGAAWTGPIPKTRGSKAAVKDGPGGLIKNGEAQKNGYVLMSATRSDQLAQEIHDPDTGKDYGAFTFALVKALKLAGEDTTYRDVFQRVSDDVSRYQHDQDPQLEGELDKKLMSGAVRTPSPYTEVSLAPNGRDVMLKAGKLMGVTAGSEYSIYEAGKDTSGQPLAKAVVDHIADLSAVLKVTPEPSNDVLNKLKTGRGMEIKHNYGDMRLKVAGIENLDADAQKQVTSLDLVAATTDDKSPDMRICKGGCKDELPSNIEKPERGGYVTLQRNAGGAVIDRSAPADGSKIAGLLESEARWRFFNRIKDGGDPTLSDKVKIRLVPVRIVETGDDGLAKKTEDLAREVAPTDGGRIELHDGDQVMLEVANTSDRDLYITVIDVSENGEVKPLFPHPAIPLGHSSENKFPRLQVDANGDPIYRRIPCPFVIGIMPPFGNEAFRVIASTEEADFSPLFNKNARGSIQRGGDPRGMQEAKTPFGQLLMSGMTGQTARGGGGDIFGVAELKDVAIRNPPMTISSVMLEIKPKQKS